MAETALQLITNALLDLGVLADEETPSASQAQGALRKLNNMIDAWNIDNLLVYGSRARIFPLVAGQATYTLGTGGNFNIPRPTQITHANLRNLNEPIPNRLDTPLYILNNQEYADLPFKGWQTNLPWSVWFDDGYPLINVTLNPIPDSSTYSIVLWTSDLIAELELIDEISLAPGYKRALESNLCIELAGSYGVPVPDTVAKIAMESKMDLRTRNLQITELSTPFRGSWFDIRTRSYW